MSWVHFTKLMIVMNLGISWATADEPSPSQSPAAHRIPPKTAPTTPEKSGEDQAPKKRKARREKKEAEGTKAPNRFDTEFNIKSKYQYLGQPLEVDTD